MKKMNQIIKNKLFKEVQITKNETDLAYKISKKIGWFLVIIIVVPIWILSLPFTFLQAWQVKKKKERERKEVIKKAMLPEYRNN